MAQANLIRDPDYPFSEALACRLFRTKIPHVFQTQYAVYESIRQLHVLNTRALTDADRYDQQTTVSKALVTKEQVTSQDPEAMRLLQALATRMGVQVSDANERQIKISDDRRHDKNSGAPTPKHKWCSHHGWSFHTSLDCKALKQRKTSSDQPQYYIKNDEGHFVPATKALRVHVVNAATVQHAQTRLEFSGPSAIYVDTGTDLSLTNSLDSISNVEVLDPESAPSIVGMSHNGAPVKLTHKGLHTLRFGNFTAFEPTYFAPEVQFNLSSTDQLASLGISTVVDSSSDNNQLSLVPPGESPAPCVRSGNVWVLPRYATTGTPPFTASLQPYIAATARKQSITPVDYRLFRSTLGNPSHERTVRVAKKLGLDLTNRSAAQSLSDSMRIANQAARPLKSLPGPDASTQPDTSIVTDTVGSTFPESTRGNRVMQTWLFASAPDDYHVTFGANHTAANSWSGFIDFARQSGLVIPANMINSGITVHSDNGTEYTGSDFVTYCHRAGILHSTSTANKKSGLQGLAEGANARVQKRMRAAIANADMYFANWGLNPRDYWDYAAQYSALQDRVSHRALAGSLSYAQLHRALPTAWGFPGIVTLQPQSPARKNDHKQLAPRGVPALLLHYHDSKYTMLLEDSTVMHTSDVHFSPVDGTCLPAKTVPSGGDTTRSSVQFNNASQCKDTPKVQPINNAASPQGVNPSDKAQTDANAATHQEMSTSEDATITDFNSRLVHIGDNVNVFWPAENQSYTGSITDINKDNGTYSVHYNDDDTMYDHLIDEAPEQLNTTVNLSMRVSTSIPVHISVRPYVTDTGDIRPDILRGDTPLPDCNLPNWTPTTAPTEPSTVSLALQTDQALNWLHAIVREYSGHVNPSMRQPTFRTSNESTDGRILNSKWVFKLKFNGQSLIKFKARLCCAGWGLTKGVDYIENYSGVAMIGDLYLLESLAQYYGLNVFEKDQTMAYCNAKMPSTPSGKPVLMRPAKGTRTFDKDGNPLNLIVDMALYGWPSSGFALAQDTSQRMLNTHPDSNNNPCPFKFLQCPHQPVIYKACLGDDPETANDLFIVWIHVDNIRCYISPTITSTVWPKFTRWLESFCEITGPDECLRTIPPESCLGTQFTYSDQGLQVSMDSFISALLDKAGMTNCKSAPTPMIPGFQLNKDMCPKNDDKRQQVVDKVQKMFADALRKHNLHVTTYQDVTHFYAMLVSSIGWIANRVGPTIALAHSILGRVMHAPTIQAFQAIKRVLRYLQGKRHLHVRFKTPSTPQTYADPDHIRPEFIIQSDASFADDESDRKSQGGYLIALKGMAPCYWSSSKSQ